MKYNKFNYRDFNKAEVIESLKEDKAISELNQIVADVVTEALNENMHSDIAPSEEHQEQVDVNAIRDESYRHGYEDAKKQFEPMMKLQQENEALEELLKVKLEQITPSLNIDNQIIEAAIKILETLAKKLHLALPVDFDRIVLGEMTSLLSKYYKNGNIKLKVHPEKVDYCQNLLKIGSLPKNVLGHIDIEVGEDMGKSDCVLVWNDTMLDYTQEQIIKDAELVIQNLK